MDRVWSAPRRVVLATDLTPSCDRAFDRAVQLAKDWKAALTIVHVVEAGEREVVGVSRRTKDAEDEMEKQIRSCREAASLQITPVITFGDPVERLLHVARDSGCDLMVMGLAHAKSFGERLMGSTMGRLLRDVSCPVLSVRGKVYGGYSEIAVGIDFSDPSRQAFDCALTHFPGSVFWLVHAYDIPLDGEAYSNFSLSKLEAGRKEEVEVFLNHAMDRFSQEGREFHRGVRKFHGHGKPDAVFGTFMEFHRPDLIVVGTHGRSGFQRLTIGSVAERLLNSLSCDVLVVRPAI